MSGNVLGVAASADGAVHIVPDHSVAGATLCGERCDRWVPPVSACSSKTCHACLFALARECQEAVLDGRAPPRIEIFSLASPVELVARDRCGVCKLALSRVDAINGTTRSPNNQEAFYAGFLGGLFAVTPYPMCARHCIVLTKVLMRARENTEANDREADEMVARAMAKGAVR